MAKLYTTTEAAAALGVSVDTIRRQAHLKRLGRQLSARVWVFTERDLAKIAARKTTPGKARKERP